MSSLIAVLIILTLGTSKTCPTATESSQSESPSTIVDSLSSSCALDANNKPEDSPMNEEQGIPCAQSLPAIDRNSIGVGNQETVRGKSKQLTGSHQGEFHFSFGGSWDNAQNWVKEGLSGLLGRKKSFQQHMPYVVPIQQRELPRKQVVESVQVLPVQFIGTPVHYNAPPPAFPASSDVTVTGGVAHNNQLSASNSNTKNIASNGNGDRFNYSPSTSGSSLQYGIRGFEQSENAFSSSQGLPYYPSASSVSSEYVNPSLLSSSLVNSRRISRLARHLARSLVG